LRDADTKTRILDAAEKLFAERGFAATSTREVIREAGVNTAAVHYHFGSREGLVSAVLKRRAAPMNEERLRLLDDLEATHPQGKVPLEGIVEAFVGPTVRLHFSPRAGGSMFPLLMARALVETDVSVHARLAEAFGEVFERFAAAISRALPHLSPGEIAWRIHFMIGTLAFTIAIPGIQPRPDRAPETSKPRPPDYPVLRRKRVRSESVDRVVERLVQFVSAGMRAPAPSSVRQGEAKSGRHGRKSAAELRSRSGGSRGPRGRRPKRRGGRT